MYALQLASGKPSALVDWNNNYGDDPDKCVFFHCGNWAKAFVPDIEISTAPILGTTLGEKNTWGALAGRTPSGPVTFGRISTDDRNGRLAAYVGEGEFTDDALKTFGTRAVVRVPELQALMRVICRRGFEHHERSRDETDRTKGAVADAAALAAGQGEVFGRWTIQSDGPGQGRCPNARRNRRRRFAGAARSRIRELPPDADQVRRQQGCDI